MILEAILRITILTLKSNSQFTLYSGARIILKQILNDTLPEFDSFTVVQLASHNKWL